MGHLPFKCLFFFFFSGSKKSLKTHVLGKLGMIGMNKVILLCLVFLKVKIY